MRRTALLIMATTLTLAACGDDDSTSQIATLASLRDWQTLIPPLAIWGGLAASLLIGVVAGLYPARRAARMAPTEALRTG